MGLFDYFTKEGKFKRHVHRMRDRDAPPEDRDASAQWLVDDGSPRAIVGLLGRFEMNLSQQMKDRAEKEWVFQMLVNMGQKVIEPTEHHLRRNKQFSYPLRLLEEVAGLDVAANMAFELLLAQAARNTFEPELKRALLLWMAEKRHAGIVAHAAPFLTDFDDEVRYAAAEAIVAQESDEAREPLLGALLNRSEDSIRLKHRVCEVFKARQWSVANAELAGLLPPAFTIQNERIVSA
jgi:hypothetical protein